MRHLTILSFGTSLGIAGERLVVHEADGRTWETALSRLRTIRIEKKGISISTNLLLACAARGIRLYLVDWRGIGIVGISGLHQHAIVNVREAQFQAIRSNLHRVIATEIIVAKIRNQRTVLLYFWKYLNKRDPDKANILRSATDTILEIANKAKCIFNYGQQCSEERWVAALMGYEGAAATAQGGHCLCRLPQVAALMGYEGAAATCYWQSLRNAGLLPESFTTREGRGSIEIVNSALNYGYAILQSYIFSALDNAGLELYAGLLHRQRPGKPALVLDLMEEYRAWVVDRNIIKLRSMLKTANGMLTSDIKSAIVNAIDETMANTVVWQSKNIRLENALQRQAYRLAGTIVDGKKYKSIRFKW